MDDKEVTAENLDSLAEEFIAAAILWFDPEGDAMSVLSFSQRRYLENLIPSETVTAAQTESDNDLVLLVGYPNAENTRRWKEQIKECSFKFSREKARWMKNDGGWRVKRGAYKLLITTYPQAEAEVTIK